MTNTTHSFWVVTFLPPLGRPWLLTFYSISFHFFPILFSYLHFFAFLCILYFYYINVFAEKKFHHVCRLPVGERRDGRVRMFPDDSIVERQPEVPRRRRELRVSLLPAVVHQTLQPDHPREDAQERLLPALVLRRLRKVLSSGRKHEKSQVNIVIYSQTFHLL